MTGLAFPINPLVGAVDAPPIPAAQAWKQTYSGALGPMIDLSQAAPGLPPPPEFLNRLAEAARQPDAARYGPILGDGNLRAAHAAMLSATYGGDVSPANVAITAGCNLAFVVSMMALARAGDNVVLPAPWYFNHRMTLDMLGVETRPLRARAANGFAPDPDEAEALIDSRTRALVLVTPNNPTGAVYSRDLIARFAGIARRRGVALVLDETYLDFLPAGQARAHDLFVESDWGATLIQLYSFSKAYAIPGHRLGAIAAAPAFIAEVQKILDCLQICPARPAQRVVAEAVASLKGWREEQRAELARRADLCRKAIAASPGWRIDSIGAYFAFVAHPWADLDSTGAARRLAVEGGVLGLPGAYFGPGIETHLRIAFANVDDVGLAALPDRLKALRG